MKRNTTFNLPKCREIVKPSTDKVHPLVVDQRFAGGGGGGTHDL